METDLAPTPPKTQRQNPKWVGLVMALHIPGSAHFFSVQRKLGVFFWFALLSPVFLACFPMSVPGVEFFYLAVMLLAIYPVFFIAVIFSSWRSTQRLGCFGWILFVGTVPLLNSAVSYPSALFFKAYVLQLHLLNGASMAPTMIAPSVDAPEVQRGDKIVANKWFYRFSNPQRGDVVIFRAWQDPSVNFTSRVVGLPNEMVDIEPPYVLINGERLTEPAIFAKMASRQDGYSGYYSFEELEREGLTLPMTLGSDEYFVLGDNSLHSADSRFHGPVRRHDITGKAIRIFYPFDRIREIE